jgi:hypothetical protein
MTLTYDTTTLVVQQLQYDNPTNQPGTFQISGPVLNKTYTTSANTTSSVDLTSYNIVCVQSQVTDKNGTHTTTQLPDGESVQFTWPT